MRFEAFRLFIGLGCHRNARVKLHTAYPGLREQPLPSDVFPLNFTAPTGVGFLAMIAKRGDYSTFHIFSPSVYAAYGTYVLVRPARCYATPSRALRECLDVLILFSTRTRKDVNNAVKSQSAGTLSSSCLFAHAQPDPCPPIAPSSTLKTF
jgi:hypothetical protein